MTDAKKPDLRDPAKNKTAVTDKDSVMADGSHEAVMPTTKSDMHVVTPEIGKNLAEGQTTKG